MIDSRNSPPESLDQAQQRIQDLQSQLAQSQKELEQFVYVASHDLQTPLRTVLGFTQLLARRYKDRLDADGLEFLHYIESGAKYLQQQVTDLLEFSRAGRREFVLEDFPLDDALNEALQQLGSAIAEKQAEVVRSPLPNLRGDRTHITRILYHLLSNALKFHHPTRSLRVEITATDQTTAWQISICDNGIGIATENLEKIFGMFARLHAEDAYPGTGAGLAICRKILERHGGRIWVQSSPEQSSCFHFTVPKSN